MLLEDPQHVLLAAFVGLLLDALIGDPAALWDRLPHPVALLGHAIAWLDRRLHVPRPRAAFLRGTALCLGVVGLAAAIGYGLTALFAALPAGALASGLAAGVLFAWGSLERHVVAVARGLEQGLEGGRNAVRHIVGRDPQALDRHGIARAAIESLAENFSDGLVAPLFWMLLLGLPGLFAAKAINTLDSMLGYRTPRYLHFGRASAKLDDALNFLPARLTALLLVAAAGLAADADARQALRILRRDARRHRSPNAGFPEAATAGALGFRLSGPRSYGGVASDEPWVGDGRADLDAADIYRALRLVRRAFSLLVAMVATGLVLVSASR